MHRCQQEESGGLEKSVGRRHPSINPIQSSPIDLQKNDGDTGGIFIKAGMLQSLNRHDR